MAEQALTLADIAGIDLSTIKDVRFEILPQIVGNFEVTEAKLDTSSGKEPKPIALIVAKVLSVDAVVGEQPADGKDSLVGKEHRQMFTFGKVEDIGRFTAFVKDCGVEFTGPTEFQVLISALKGYQFPGKIVHRLDKNDPSITRASLNPIPVKDRAA